MAGYGAQGGYGGDQFQDPNLVGGQGGFNQQQAGGSDQDAIKQQKIQAVEQDPSLTAEEKKHRRHKIEEEVAAGLGVAALGYEVWKVYHVIRIPDYADAYSGWNDSGYKHHEKKKGEEATGEKKHSFF